MSSLAVFTRKTRGQLGLPVIGLLLVGVLTITRILSSRYVALSLPAGVQDFITLSVSIIVEALPFVLLGLALSILVQVWLPQAILFKLLPRRKVPRRLVLSCLGVFLPVCECGNIPLARGLMVKGLSLGDSLTFLLAAPIINPITIVTTQQAFGGDSTILIARLLGGLLIANLVGWLFDSYRNQDELLTPKFAASCKVDHEATEHTHSKLRRSFEVFVSEANVILPALFVGSFIAGLVQVVVPRSVLVDLGGHVVLSIVAMMALAFIVSICANVDAFFALAFANSFTAGSLVSFLIFGPIVDIKMLNLMRTTYKRRVLVLITLVTVLVSGILGLAVNYAF